MRPDEWKRLPGAPKGKAPFNSHTVRHPRDWNTPTLRALCELVRWTDNDFGRVQSLITQASKTPRVKQIFRKAGSPVLCDRVVEEAASILRKSTTTSGDRGTAGIAGMGHNDHMRGRQRAPSPIAGPSNSQPTLPQSPPATTFTPCHTQRPTTTAGAPTVPNMLESRLVAASPRASSFRDGERNAYMERCMEQLAYLDDEDDYFNKKREANNAERRCLDRILRNAGRVGAHGLLIGQT